MLRCALGIIVNISYSNLLLNNYRFFGIHIFIANFEKNYSLCLRRYLNHAKTALLSA